MLRDGNQIQMWMQPTTRDTFKQIGLVTGESQADVAARLAEQERKRLARKAQKGGGDNA